jgi:hypothetical protein
MTERERNWWSKCAQKNRNKNKQKRGIVDSWGIFDDPATLFQTDSFPAPFPGASPAQQNAIDPQKRRRYANQSLNNVKTEDDAPDQDAVFFAEKYQIGRF